MTSILHCPRQGTGVSRFIKNETRRGYTRKKGLVRFSLWNNLATVPSDATLKKNIIFFLFFYCFFLKKKPCQKKRTKNAFFFGKSVFFFFLNKIIFSVNIAQSNCISLLTKHFSIIYRSCNSQILTRIIILSGSV